MTYGRKRSIILSDQCRLWRPATPFIAQTAVAVFLPHTLRGIVVGSDTHYLDKIMTQYCNIPHIFIGTYKIPSLLQWKFEHRTSNYRCGNLINFTRTTKTTPYWVLSSWRVRGRSYSEDRSHEFDSRQGQDISYSPQRPDRMRPTQPPINCAPSAFLLETSRPEWEAGHSPPSAPTPEHVHLHIY